MKRPKLASLLIFITTVAFSSCLPSLTGEWKLEQIVIVDSLENKVHTMDFSDPDSLKTALLKRFLKEAQELGGVPDTSQLIFDISRIVASYVNARLILADNYDFKMASSDALIIPPNISGWNYGDTIRGRWIKNNDTLVLTTVERNPGSTWKFEILELTKNRLKLQGIFENINDKGNHLYYVRQ